MPTPVTIDKLAEVSALKKRFHAINRERLERTRSALRERQREFLDVLPLLFHANHPALPGFVSKQTPVGVSDYSPSKRALEAVKRHARSFDFKRRALPTYDIQSIFVMGSIGTIAYSDKSDFDIWLCHKPGLAPGLLEELRIKAHEIEKLANQSDLEAHIFVMDPQSFKEGRHDDLSTESSGTAQHFLLLEEFYRTGLLMAGRYPIWWLVPPESERGYDGYVRELKHRRFIREDECVDFGGVPAIPADEFLGAALWQLSKGIDSPYKSVLKLLLMEAYATEYPRTDLLCQRFKRAIIGGETNLSNLDPYIMLYRKIEEHLKKSGNPQRLEMLRRCFYFKVNEQLSTPDNPRFRTWQRELMLELVRAWQWPKDDLVTLDARNRWKIDLVSKERQVLVEQLTKSYQFLSNFTRERTQLSLISQQDLNILGRKLYAAFERKAGKIEILNRGISEDLWENHLGIQQIPQRNAADNWVLYRGGSATDTQARTLLKRARSLVELLAWCYFNCLIDNSTLITLQSEDGALTIKEVREMLRCLRRHFPLSELSGHDLNALANPPQVLKSVVFANTGVDPLSMHTRQGRHLTTVKTDALSFGGLGENLALTFDLVLRTSWNEIQTFRYTGQDALMECLCNYLQWTPRSGGGRPVAFSAYSFSSNRGPSIAQRLEELFKDITARFYAVEGGETARYVVMVKHHYYVLYIEGGQFRYLRIGSYDDLLRYLGAPGSDYSAVTIDRHALTDTPLPVLFMTNRPDVIQLYYRLDGTNAQIYILDEQGSLFMQNQAFKDPALLLNQYTRFLKAIRHRQRLQMPVQAENEKTDDFISYYQIKKNLQRRWRLDRQDMVDLESHEKYLEVRVIGENGEDNKPVFTFYCAGREFTSLEYGQDLYDEVAKHILQQRQSGAAYPLYITDIDLPPSMFGDASTSLQTVHFLNYKKLIEDHLNEALSRFAAGRTARSGLLGQNPA